MERPLLLDDLTGAYLRSELAPTLENLAEEHAVTGVHYALAVIDLDHLKTLNDVYGHATGDAALRAVADRTYEVLRAGDLVFRYGGDEFVVLLPNANGAEAESILKRVRNQVLSNPVEGPVWVSVNISVGVAATDEYGSDLTHLDLFERADARLYSAKRAGRNSVVAQDVKFSSAAGSSLAETRVVGRDEALVKVDQFLAASASIPDDRSLLLRGPRGAGFTRFLKETGVRARIAGRTVREVSGDATRQGVHLSALEQAYAEVLGPDPSEAEVAERLNNDADAHGLVVLVEEGRSLDPGSRRLLTEQLRKGGVKLIEAVPDGDTPAFYGLRHLSLAPLSRDEVGNWMAAALLGPLQDELISALTEASGGLPGPLARLVDELRREGALRGEGADTENDVARIFERAHAADRARNAPPLELPWWPEPLIGRSRWLATVRGSVRGAPLVTLVGPGGVGKSRLAAQLARELADEAVEGSHWIDLRAVRGSDSLPGVISETLGLRSSDSVEDLATQLRGQRRRLILDEADAFAEDAGVLSELLEQNHQLQLLVTSRMPLRLAQERVLEVPELSPPAAAELLRRGMIRTGAEAMATDEQLLDLVDLVGATPLALELAGAWSRSFTITELIEEVSKRPAILADVRGMKERTARFIDVTRHLMSTAEQEALGVLAYIPGGFSADEGREAAGVSPFFLLALLERSLIRREGARYTVHSAVAERYREGLAKPQLARERIAFTYARLAEHLDGFERSERSRHGYRRVDEERPNLLFAWRELLKLRDEQHVWPLVRLLRGYFDVRGHAREGLDLFEAAVLAFSASEDKELRAFLLDAVALYSIQRGDALKAKQRIEEGLELLSSRAETSTSAMLLNTAGVVAGLSNDDEAARSYFENAAALQRRLGDPVGEAQARGNVALVLAQMERPNEAYEALIQAEAGYRTVEHDVGLALTLTRMADLARKNELLPIEQVLFKASEGLQLAERIDYAQGARDGAEVLAQALLAANRPQEAADAFGLASNWAEIEENESEVKRLKALMQEASESAEAAFRDGVEVAN